MEEIDKNIEETKDVKETEQTETQEVKQTFTLDEVKNLLNAKNAQKATNKQLKEEIAQLKKNATKNDESVVKFKEDEYNSLKAELESLKNQKSQLVQAQEDASLKDQIRLMKGILPEALDDVLAKAKKNGFKKTEIGYLDANGKTLTDFYNGLKESNSYYFGISSNKRIVPEALQRQIDSAKKTGNTLPLIQEAFKNIDLRNLK